MEISKLTNTISNAYPKSEQNKANADNSFAQVLEETNMQKVHSMRFLLSDVSFEVYKTDDVNKFMVKTTQKGVEKNELIDVSKIDPKYASASEMYAYGAFLDSSGKARELNLALPREVAQSGGVFSEFGLKLAEILAGENKSPSSLDKINWQKIANELANNPFAKSKGMSWQNFLELLG